MRYMLLIYDEETKVAKMSKPERGAIHQEYGEFIDDIRKKGAFLAGDPLQPTSTATTVRGKNGKTITTDGPFAETKEQLGGYFIVEAKNIDEIFRTEYGRILATLIRVLGDFDVAEDALQEAFAAALERWPAAGLPTNPVAWLIGTARHKAIDRLRRRSRLARKEAEIARHIELSTAEEEAPVPEDRLRLIFTCCHPALATEAQVALTLRTLGGLSTEEIARAFLVPASTMAQ